MNRIEQSKLDVSSGPFIDNDGGKMSPSLSPNASNLFESDITPT